MSIDVAANLEKFRQRRRGENRYASFDYCFNHFQAAREAGRTDRLADEDHLQLSCLQLGFYLASMGMMRGSGDLAKRSVRGLVPVVEMIALEAASTWDLDAHSYADDADEVLALRNRVRKAFTVKASDILVTKTMAGVFGCVPALNRQFRKGFRCQTLNRPLLKRIGEFYEYNRVQIDAAKVLTLAFATGLETERDYSRAKIIDMVFSEEGLNGS